MEFFQKKPVGVKKENSHPQRMRALMLFASAGLMNLELLLLAFLEGNLDLHDSE